MKLETLQKEMVAAMKNKDKARKDTISTLIGAIKKTAIDEKCKENITEELVDRIILKEKKTVQEMIDTCPTDRTETLVEYTHRMKVIDEFAPHIAVYDKVYTKDETQEIVSNMLNDFEQEMHLSYHNSISRIENDMSILQDELNRIDENNNALVQTKELVDNTILTTGEGKLFLADDGKYHDIGELELISYGVATITNDDIDENGIGKVNIRIPILPKTHTLHFDIKLPYTTFNQIYAKGVKVWSEFNKFEKNWFDNRTMFKVAFDNNVLQFKQGNEEQQMISNLIKSRTYFDEDEVKDTLIIRPTLIDIIHEEYNATIEIKLEGKIPDNATSPILVTYHIFGDIYK